MIDLASKVSPYLPLPSPVFPGAQQVTLLPFSWQHNRNRCAPTIRGGVIDTSSASITPTYDTLAALASNPKTQSAAARRVAAEGLAEAVEPLLGGYYHFKTPELLLEAFTHVSLLGMPSYQLLEFLGDALIDVMVSLNIIRNGLNGR